MILSLLPLRGLSALGRARLLRSLFHSIGLACTLPMVFGCKMDCEGSTRANCQEGDPPGGSRSSTTTDGATSQGCPPNGLRYHNAGDPLPVSFEEPITHAVGRVHELQLGDLNGDGHLDVVATPTSTYRELREGEFEPLWIALGDGTGEFEALPPLTLEFDLPEPTGELEVELPVAIPVVVVDLDGDGFTDLLISGLLGQPSTPQVIWGGAQFPEERSSLGVAHSSRLFTFLLPGDFDNDGRVDVAACAGRCEVAFGKGGREWTEFFRANESAWDFVLLPTQLTFDLYGTGQDLLATLGPSGLFVAQTDYWQAEERDSWAIAATTTPGIPVGAVTIGDLDGDRRDDVVVRGGGDRVQVYWNHFGEFALQDYCLEQSTSRVVNSPLPELSVMGDFDGDQRQDVVVGSRRSLSAGAGAWMFSLLGGTDAQQLRRPAQMQVPWSAVSALAAGDINGDGRDDVLAAHEEPDGFSVLLTSEPHSEGR